MNIASSTQMTLLPLVALVALFVNMRRRLPYTRSNALLEALVCMVMIILVVVFFLDLPIWTGAASTVPILYALNIVYYLSAGLLAAGWAGYIYVVATPQERMLSKTREGLILFLLVLFYSALVLTTPWTGVLFFVDDAARYCRGSFYFLFVIWAFVVMVLPSILVLLRRARTQDLDERRRLGALALFIVPVVVGMVLQVVFPDITFAEPSLALSLVLVYLNLQDGWLMRDSLTGLNNRRQFDHRFAALCDQEGGERFYLASIDVNDFKTINDTLGHSAGDVALRRVGDTLRHVYGRKGAFVARVGGDEFVVVMQERPGVDFPALVDEMHRELREGVGGGGVFAVGMMGSPSATSLSVSIGYVLFRQGEMADPDSLIVAADERMYEQKRAFVEKKTRTDGIARS